MHEWSNQQTRREMADYLGISPKTADRWRARGEGPPYIWVGGKVRYLRRDVDEWLERKRVYPVREYLPAECQGGIHQRVPPAARRGR